MGIFDRFKSKNSDDFKRVKLISGGAIVDGSTVEFEIKRKGADNYEIRSCKFLGKDIGIPKLDDKALKTIFEMDKEYINLDDTVAGNKNDFREMNESVKKMLSHPFTLGKVVDKIDNRAEIKDLLESGMIKDNLNFDKALKKMAIYEGKSVFDVKQSILHTDVKEERVKEVDSAVLLQEQMKAVTAAITELTKVVVSLKVDSVKAENVNKEEESKEVVKVEVESTQKVDAPEAAQKDTNEPKKSVKVKAPAPKKEEVKTKPKKVEDGLDKLKKDVIGKIGKSHKEIHDVMKQVNGTLSKKYLLKADYDGELGINSLKKKYTELITDAKSEGEILQLQNEGAILLMKSFKNSIESKEMSKADHKALNLTPLNEVVKSAIERLISSGVDDKLLPSKDAIGISMLESGMGLRATQEEVILADEGIVTNVEDYILSSDETLDIIEQQIQENEKSKFESKSQQELDEEFRLHS